MNKQIITFSADEQKLVKTGGINCYASNIVSYIEAHFALGQNWSGHDSVRAVWSNDNNMTVISTVLDSNGHCLVPFEVLKTMGVVKVNLVGSISVSDVLTDRLTTFPCEALTVARKAKINGSETAPITPSQFEQFIAIVISEVEKVTGMTAEAETLPAGSSATARYDNGVLYLGIPQGIQGERGETGEDGNGIAQVLYNSDYSITFVFTNGERFTTPSLRGETGPQGQPGQNGRDGADGVTPSLSVGTVTTLPSNEDAYVTRRGTDENPVFDFGIPQGPKGDKGDTGEVSYADLSSLLPTDTASGSIASFPDGQSVIPAVSVKAEIEPIQDLHGYDKPWAAGAGKNKCSLSDNTFVQFDEKEIVPIPSGAYVFSAVVTSTDTDSSQCAIVFLDADKNTLASRPLNRSTGEARVASTEFTVSAPIKYLRFYASNGFPSGAGDTATFADIMIESGGSATSYEPYSNECPISGRTEVVTSVVGKNLFNPSGVENGAFDQTTGEKIAGVQSQQRSTYYIKCNAGQKVIQKNGASFACRVFYFLGDKYVSTSALANNTAITVPNGVDRFYFTSGTSAFSAYTDLQIELDSSPSTYEAFNGTTYTTDLGRTVYGGTLDVVSGELTDKMGMVDLSTLPWGKSSSTSASGGTVFTVPLESIGNGAKPRERYTPNNVYSDKYATAETSVWWVNELPDFSVLVGATAMVIADSRYDTEQEFKSANVGAQLCYELATPQTYQLDPTEIALLEGQNNVWTDSGEVEVTYKADVGLYIDKKLNG